MTINEAIEMLKHAKALNEAGLLSSSAAADIKSRIGEHIGDSKGEQAFSAALHKAFGLEPIKKCDSCGHVYSDGRTICIYNKDDVNEDGIFVSDADVDEYDVCKDCADHVRMFLEGDADLN